MDGDERTVTGNEDSSGRVEGRFGVFCGFLNGLEEGFWDSGGTLETWLVVGFSGLVRGTGLNPVAWMIHVA